jgi:hypothetical protein
VEKEILKISPLAEVTSIECTDPIDYKSGPIHIVVKYKIPEYAFVASDQVLFTPVTASNVFKNYQPQLFFETWIKDRKYPFRDRCSRLVELSESIQLPGNLKSEYLPVVKNNKGDICSFHGGYDWKDHTLILNAKIVLGKRIYDAKDWPEFRDAVISQTSFANDPVVFRVQN